MLRHCSPLLASLLALAPLGAAEQPTETTAPEPAAATARTEESTVAWLGVSVASSSQVLQRQLGLLPDSGLVVTYVDPDSPAASVGLQQHDVLVQLGDQLLINPAQFQTLLRHRQPGTDVALDLRRDGQALTLDVELGARPATPDADVGGDRLARLQAWLDEQGHQGFRVLEPMEVQEWTKHFDEATQARIREQLADRLGVVQLQLDGVQAEVDGRMGQVQLDVEEMKERIKQRLEAQRRAQGQAQPGQGWGVGGVKTRRLMHLHGYDVAVTKDDDAVTLKISGADDGVLFDGDPAELDLATVPEAIRERVGKLVARLQAAQAAIDNETGESDATDDAAGSEEVGDLF